jgi:hypothetical protein
MKTRYLLTASVLAASLAMIAPASAGGFFGFSTFDGHTTVVAGDGEGDRSVISFGLGLGFHAREHHRPMPGSIQVDDGHGGWTDYHHPAKSDVIGSSSYRGRDTMVTRNPDNSRTVTTTEKGRTSSEVRREPARGSIQVDDGKGGWTDYKPQPRSNVIGSSSFEGRDTMVTRNPDNSRTVTTTENGKTDTRVLRDPPKGSIQIDDGKGGWTDYKPQPKSDILGSSTYNGVTTVVTKDDVKPKLPKGISVDDGKGGWKPYVAPPKSNVIGSSTYDGKTTTVTDNGNGTHTVTVTDENGRSASEVHAAHR